MAKALSIRHTCPDCGGPTVPAGGLSGSLAREVCPACRLLITHLFGGGSHLDGEAKD